MQSLIISGVIIDTYKRPSGFHDDIVASVERVGISRRDPSVIAAASFVLSPKGIKAPRVHVAPGAKDIVRLFHSIFPEFSLQTLAEFPCTLWITMCILSSEILWILPLRALTLRISLN